ncbi:hypothetical protein AAJ76_328000803 [Vairimorpha ceranae]|uniref:Uncharacterized protein n=1 Tax=Vairimorpha ceranae TaxID=40302 RepID=A0A0F9Z6W9_9MICR|nr:hypothetical protein AAJ76_328000803 [Vairimorpha ceranae]KKO73669.1 hypothetical protein AAJ76_328000803 [Vairimorpha ceranae]
MVERTPARRPILLNCLIERRPHYCFTFKSLSKREVLYIQTAGKAIAVFQETDTRIVQ